MGVEELIVEVSVAVQPFNERIHAIRTGGPKKEKTPECGPI
jgi:hypothetical protein